MILFFVIGELGEWSLAWLVFLTIPIYRWVAGIMDERGEDEEMLLGQGASDTAFQVAQEHEFGVDEVRSIDVSLSSDTLMVLPSADGSFVVREEVLPGLWGSAPSPVAVSLSDDGTLRVERRQEGGATGFLWFGKDWHRRIVVEVPASAELAEVHLAASSGTQLVRGISCERLDASLTSGDVRIAGADVGTLAVGLSSGSADVEARVRDALELTATSGSAHATCVDEAPASIAVGFSSGSVDLALPAGTVLDGRVSHSSGSLSSDLPLDGGTGATSLSATYTSGSLRIRAL